MKTVNTPIRTLNDRTPKWVQSHTQPPVGMVICPHCHEETKIFAAGVFNIMGQPHPMQEVLRTNLLVKVPQQKIVYHHCGGKAWLGKSDVLHVWPTDPGPEVRESEAILNRKKLAVHPKEGPEFI